MSFKQKLLGALGLQVAVKKNIFTNVIMNTFGVTARWHGDGYKDNVEAYTSNSTLYTVVKRISDMAAIAPFKVYKIKSGQKALHEKYQSWTGARATEASIFNAMRIKSLVYEEDNAHELNELIEKPNEDQKGSEFTTNSIGFKLLTGNRFLNVDKYPSPEDGGGADGGKPYGVFNLPPQHMIIVPDGTPYGVKEFRFGLDRQAEPIPTDQIIHSKYFNPVFEIDGSHLWGLSPVRAGSKNLTRSDAALERGTAMMQNAGSAGAVVDETGDDLSLEQMYDVKDKMNNTINSSKNSGKIGYLKGKFSYLNFGLNANDMQVLATEKYSDQKIANIYSFPPGALDPDKATFANSKEFNKQIITGAVIPELSSLRDDWNEIAKLYKEEIYVDYDLSVYPELQEDLATLAATLEKIPYLKWNEKRLMIGQDEDTENEMMNEYFVPNNLTPLSQLGDNSDALMNEMDNV